jgi:hypothetical protein
MTVHHHSKGSRLLIATSANFGLLFSVPTSEFIYPVSQVHIGVTSELKKNLEAIEKS